MGRNFQILVSVVSHGHGELLTALLDDLCAIRPPNLSIIVTLNIPEASQVRRDRWADIVWIENTEPKGFGANHNAALLGQAHDWYIILNPDIRIDRDVFTPLVAAGEADQSVALVAPRVVDSSGFEQDSVRALPTPGRLMLRTISRLVGQAPSSTSEHKGDWLAGMFLAVRGTTFRLIGGFDERFFLYCEDVDLSARLRLAGFELRQVREVQVVHDARRESLRSFQYVRWHLTSLLRLWGSASFWKYRSLRSSQANGVKAPLEHRL